MLLNGIISTITDVLRFGVNSRYARSIKSSSSILHV